MNDTAEPVVIKAFAVIEVILAARRPLSLPELAEALGRPKQTVHRTARQLEEHGFLYREPLRDRYAIGPKLFDISKEVFGWCVRYAPRNAVLARLVEQVAETCNVGILDGDSVLYLDRVESNFRSVPNCIRAAAYRCTAPVSANCFSLTCRPEPANGCWTGSSLKRSPSGR